MKNEIGDSVLIRGIIKEERKTLTGTLYKIEVEGAVAPWEFALVPLVIRNETREMDVKTEVKDGE